MNHAISLQGECFVTHTEALAYRSEGTWKWAQAIGLDDQARSLSLFCIELSEGQTPWLACGESDAILYSLEGDCKLHIGEREFELRPGTGAHVRPGERFRLQKKQPGEARLLLSYCPRREGLAFDDEGDFQFDQRFPTRTVETNRSPTQAAGDREFRLLVGPATGASQVTQFVGRIPQSSAPEHHHLYEEAICILSGEGRMWTGDRSAPVRPGSLIFLPRRQPHSLQCESKEGMTLVGVFYPAGSPAVSYS